LIRLVDAVAEIGPPASDEPFPVETLDLFGVLGHAERGGASGLDRVAEALSALAESGADPSVLIVGKTGRIRFAQRAARQLLLAYFGPDDGYLPGVLQDWVDDAGGEAEIVIDGPAGRLVASAPSPRSAGCLVILLHERPRVPPRSRLLTPREREVLELVDEGCSNAEIADTLWLSPGTVRKHLENAYGKLGVRSRTEATAVIRREAAQASRGLT